MNKKIARGWLEPLTFESQKQCLTTELQGSHTLGPHFNLDPRCSWTRDALGPEMHLDPRHTWTRDTLGPETHLDPRHTWTRDTLGPQHTWT